MPEVGSCTKRQIDFTDTRYCYLYNIHSLTTLLFLCGSFLLCGRAAQDIFRKYPNRYESIISALCENLDTLDEPEAKVEYIN